MSLLLKKLNQASAQKAADEDAEKSAAPQQESAQARPAGDSVEPKPAAPATPPAPAVTAAQPATPAQPAPGSVSIKSGAQPSEPSIAKPAPGAPGSAGLRVSPPSAIPAPAAKSPPVAAGVQPATTSAPAVAAPATAAVAPPEPKTTGVQLATAASAAGETLNKPQAKRRARDLPPALRAADYFDRARVSAARVLGAQASDGGRKWPKIVASAAAVVVVAVGGFYAYSHFSSSERDGVVAGGQARQGAVSQEGEAAVVALPSPAVDIQAQVAAVSMPQAEEAVEAVTVRGEDAIADYEIVPDVQYSDEEWSLIEREEREFVETEEREIAVIAASEPVGVEEGREFDIKVGSIDVPDDNISVRADNTAKVANRAAIKSSEQAVRRADKLSQAADLYAAGRYERAGRVYGEVLHNTPSNLQALRGSALAATAMRRYQLAADFYVQILKFFPDDPFAVAELANLGGIDPLEVERLLKGLVGKTPSIDGRLYFALGNVYAASSRWNKARDAFGDALSREKNPDYAYNLAVALEYLRKPELAVHYYRQALQMAQGAATAGFDADEVKSRIAVLEA